MRLPKNEVYRLAERLGAHVEWEDSGRLFKIRVAAPRGQHWNDGAVHELLAEGYRPLTAVQKDDLWIDLLRRMEAGLEPCDLNRNECADWALE